MAGVGVVLAAETWDHMTVESLLQEQKYTATSLQLRSLNFATLEYLQSLTS